MIQVIAGKKGSGKTKRILDLANHASKDSKHDLLFLDDDNRYMFDLRHEVRFVNAGDYEIDNDRMFLGFLAGAVSQNFDVGIIFIDAFKRLIKTDLNDCGWFFERLAQLSAQHNVDFVLSISADVDVLPEFIKTYVI